MNEKAKKGTAQSTQPDEIWPPVDEWQEEVHAAATFFAAELFQIHEGWNRLEDLGWVEEFGSESQRKILNIDPLSIRASEEEKRD